MNAKEEEISIPPAFPGVGINETANVEKAFKPATSISCDQYKFVVNDFMTKNGKANVKKYSTIEMRMRKIKCHGFFAMVLKHILKSKTVL